MTIQLLGVPTDVNSSFHRGPARAPEAIRRALWSDASNPAASNGVELDSVLVDDRGDLVLAESPEDFSVVARAAAEAFGRGPAVFIGGDHSITFPILTGLHAAGRSPPHIVHIDAHPDLYDDFAGNPTSHASPFARVMERGLAASLTQIGVRTLNAHQREQITRFGVRAFTPDALSQAMTSLPKGDVYLSIDMDGLDPAYAPGVSHHEPGGLTVREVLGVIDAIPGGLVGADVVELNPDRDLNDMTAVVAAKLLKEILGRMVAEQQRR